MKKLTRSEYEEEARTALEIACEQLPEEDNSDREFYYNLTFAVVHALLAVAQAIDNTDHE